MIMNYGLKTSLIESLKNYALASKGKGKRTHKENKPPVSQTKCLSKTNCKGRLLCESELLQCLAMCHLGPCWAVSGSSWHCPVPSQEPPAPPGAAPLQLGVGSSKNDPSDHQSQCRAQLGASGAFLEFCRAL